MKRVLAIAILVIALMMSLCGCNESWGIGNYSFTHVHISNGVEGHCATVESWHDNELGVELHTKEFGDIYCSEGTYFLYADGAKCPFCNGD